MFLLSEFCEKNAERTTSGLVSGGADVQLDKSCGFVPPERQAPDVRYKQW